MFREVGAFLLVWSSWSLLDETILQFHPLAETAVFFLGLSLLIPWDSVRECLIHKPSRIATEALERV